MPRFMLPLHLCILVSVVCSAATLDWSACRIALELYWFFPSCFSCEVFAVVRLPSATSMTPLALFHHVTCERPHSYDG
ncbi:hypothetical protein EV363DRAFT_14947 [Boletus edulis]|nr:hypothetical protein EV363DRAFT_14947 [Boletus edulis]